MGQTHIQYAVKRTQRRKTASLRIVDGEVTVVVPDRFSDKQVQDLVLSRSDQIQKTIKLQKGLMRKTETEFVSGQGLKYLGRTYRLKVYPTGSGQTGLRQGRIEVWVTGEKFSTSESVKQHLLTWYQTRAREKLTERMKLLRKEVGVNVETFSLRDMRTKWGSCTSKGLITLNWRLIFAPTRIIDYVIVHELCHLLDLNHSRKFWAKVLRVCPDFDSSREWLKQNGHLLTI
jgi:hypothetical protein